MKKNFIALGLICAAAFTLTNCSKELENPSKSDFPFEITATTGTKTTNNGLNTVWASGDILQVFHAATGTTEYGTKDLFDFVSDNSFKAEAELKNPLESGNYDWYAVYCGLSKTHDYFTGTTTPAAVSLYLGRTTNLKQTGNDNKEHLSGSHCPLYGLNTNLSSSSKVNIPMYNLASVVEIEVTNKKEEALTVATVSLTSPEAIVGKFVLDITKSPVEYTPDAEALKTANLGVTSGTPIAKDGKASFYIPIAPHKLLSGQKLSITVNGYEKELTLTKDIEFKAGIIHKLSFNYDAPEAYKSAIFTQESFRKGVSSYSETTFESTTEGFVVTINNFNNNNKHWDLIKAGSKKAATVSSISTNAAIDKAISKVSVYISAISKTAEVNSIKLYSGDSADAINYEEGSFEISAGTQEVSIATPTAGKYYKIVFDNPQTTNNGNISVNQVEFWE